jgi:hypothetical protein
VAGRMDEKKGQMRRRSWQVERTVAGKKKIKKKFSLGELF